MRLSKHIYYVAFISLCLLFCKCSSTDKTFDKHILGKKYYLNARPVGVVKIAKNFFYDQTEITNTDWREYLYWNYWVFGANSYEYKSALPDTNVWSDSQKLKGKSLCLKPNSIFYLRHPLFMSYPVVGVSQMQAIKYSKWRSDRVMEYLLIAHKKFDWDSVPNPDTYFSIERYFTGNYKNLKPDTNFLYYPNYRLPTLKEWKLAVHYADSINRFLYKDTILVFRSDFDPCLNDTLWKYEPTDSVYVGFKSEKELTDFMNIYNLRGNVSEWTSEDGICVGGGWADKRQTILTQDTFYLKTQNAWTGFRNVCEWKRWTK